jgi:Holliday junction resolvasome RuvABC endonuclease subunit
MADQLTVLGLDTGLTSTGGAKVTGGALGGAPWLFQIQSKRKGVERLDSQLTRIGQAVKETDPDLIAMEGPSLHSSGAYWHENAGLWHAVRLAVWREGRPCVVIPPATLKKWATGRGNADKTAMCIAAVTRLGLSEEQARLQDQVDALWLAAACLEHYGLPLVKMPAAQVDALGKVGWPVSLDRPRPVQVPA